MLSDDLKWKGEQQTEQNLTEKGYKVIQYYFDILEVLLSELIIIDVQHSEYTKALL